ncbi:uncharacterized protein [Ptychodera flava]|uniref:uncharacterized protein n=1 Tax=Ptychodera flava TaxID=63121 RepID=UPI00396A100E
MSELPTGPWEEVSIDFSDLPNGKYLLVMTDDYSRYPVVEIIHSTSAAAVMSKVDSIFTLFGIPRIVHSDNGPPFSGVPPATLLFGRPMRTRVPEYTTQQKDDRNLRFRDKERKASMKCYADNRENIQKNQVKVGDTVLVKRDGHVKKEVTPYLT